MLTETDFLFSVLPLAFGNKISMALVVTKVDAKIKKTNSKNTISVIDDMLKLGLTLFLPLRFIRQVHLINLRTPLTLPPFDTLPCLFLPPDDCKRYRQ